MCTESEEQLEEGLEAPQCFSFSRLNGSTHIFLSHMDFIWNCCLCRIYLYKL